MKIRSFAWSGMTLLALLVAVYAGMVLLVPDFRPPLVRTLLVEQRFSALGHFMTGGIALVAGALQLNSRLRVRFIEFHRWLGRIYVIAVMIGGVAGFAMSFQSMGGLTAHLGFGLLAVCWVGSTFVAYRFIRQRNITAHRSWMIRSYALTLAAVTLRIYLPLSQTTGASMAVAYPVIAWLCWVPNLLIAEWFIGRKREFTASAL